MPEQSSQNENGPQAAGGDELRIGVYVCHCGGNISDKVDVKSVAEDAGKLPGVAVARTHMFMCSDPGQALIVEDIAKHNLNHVVVASCSPSLHETTFRTAVARGGLNPFLYEHANIREQVSWAHPAGEAATNKASVLVRAAVAKASNLIPLESIRVEASVHALIIGGGVAGLRAAIDLSRRGIPVTIVEKAPSLGGRVMDLNEIYPTRQAGKEVAGALVRQVEEDAGITVLTGARVTQISGYVGNFNITVAQDQEGQSTSQDLRAGVIVVATGFDPYQPSQGEFGYGRQPRTVTLSDFGALMAAQADSQGPLTFEGKPVRNIAFVHCVGSRQIEGVHEPGESGRLNQYCSRTCCTAMLKAINDLHDRWPDIHVYDFYRDIRTYGRGHEELYEEASKGGTVFIRYPGEAPPTVKDAGPGEAGHLLISAADDLTAHEEIEALVDLVVLAVGMVPRNIDELIKGLKLPQGADGFLQEVHPKLRPVETSVNGVVLAGTAQAPKDITETCSSASAAAAKAASILTKGHVDLEPFVVRVDASRCEGNGLCVEECGYEGALTLEEFEQDGRKGRRAVVNEALCVGCGACVAVCPTRALDVAGWTLDQFDAMLDAIAAASSVEEAPA